MALLVPGHIICHCTFWSLQQNTESSFSLRQDAGCWTAYRAG
jgi:hypothetical protein